MHHIQVKGILSAHDGMNLYRGCTHGCIYCDARSDRYRTEDRPFEDVAVKQDALALLEDTLRRKRRACMIGTGSMTDPYLPLERTLGLTRGALALIDRYGFGATLQTKSADVLRDLDLLRSIHAKAKCVVQMTLTTADEALCRQIEPHVSTTQERVAALHALHAAGIPTVVWLSPILPFLNDTEENVRAILAQCAEAGVWGVLCFGMGVTLRAGSRSWFYRNLDRLFPGLKERYVRTYGDRYYLGSPREAALMRLFHETCERYGLVHDNDRIFAYLSTLDEPQMSLW